METILLRVFSCFSVFTGLCLNRSWGEMSYCLSFLEAWGKCRRALWCSLSSTCGASLRSSGRKIGKLPCWTIGKKREKCRDLLEFDSEYFMAEVLSNTVSIYCMCLQDVSDPVKSEKCPNVFWKTPLCMLQLICSRFSASHRYPFYMLACIGLEWRLLTWLRFTIWAVLYPLGTLAEGEKTLTISVLLVFKHTGPLFAFHCLHTSDLSFIRVYCTLSLSLSAVAVVQSLSIFDESGLYSIPLPAALGQSISFSFTLKLYLFVMFLGKNTSGFNYVSRQRCPLRWSCYVCFSMMSSLLCTLRKIKVGIRLYQHWK